MKRSRSESARPWRMDGLVKERTELREATLLKNESKTIQGS